MFSFSFYFCDNILICLEIVINYIFIAEINVSDDEVEDMNDDGFLNDTDKRIHNIEEENTKDIEDKSMDDIRDKSMENIEDNSMDIGDNSMEDIEDLSFLDETRVTAEIDKDVNVGRTGDDAGDEAHALRKWALHYDISHKALDELLLILGKRLLPQLPKNSETFLHTKSKL